MAWADINLPADSFAKVYLATDEWNDWLVKEWMEKKVSIFREHMPGLYPRLKTMTPGKSFKRRWMFGHAHPTSLVCTLAGSGTRTLEVTGQLYGKAITRASLLNVVRVGAVLRYDSGGTTSMARVTAIDASNPIMSVEATGDTSLPTNGTSQTWRRISKPFTDSKAASDSPMSDRDTLYTGTEIFEGTITLEKSRIIIQMQNDIDEVEYQTDLMLEDMEMQVADAAIWQIPQISGGVPQTLRENEEPRLFGLDWWFDYLFGSGGKFENTNLVRNMAGKPVSLTVLDEQMTYLLQHGVNVNKMNLEIWTTPTIKDYMKTYELAYARDDYDTDTVGRKIESVRLAHREKPVPVYSDDRYMDGFMHMLNMDCPHIGDVEGDTLKKERMPTETQRKIKDQWTRQKEGLMITSPKELGCKLYNIDPNG